MRSLHRRSSGRVFLLMWRWVKTENGAVLVNFDHVARIYNIEGLQGKFKTEIDFAEGGKFLLSTDTIQEILDRGSESFRA